MRLKKLENLPTLGQGGGIFFPLFCTLPKEKSGDDDIWGWDWKCWRRAKLAQPIPESAVSNPSAGVQMYTSGQYVNIPCMFNPTRVHCQYLSTMFSQIKIWDGNFIGEAMVIGGHNVPMSTRHCLVQIFTVQLFFSYCDPQVPLSNAPIIICPDSSLFSFRLLWLQDCGVFSSRFTDAIILQGPGRFKDYLHVISDTKIKSRWMTCEHIFYILRPPFKQSYVSGPGHVPLLGSTVGWGKCKKC